MNLVGQHTETETFDGSPALAAMFSGSSSIYEWYGLMSRYTFR